MPDRATEILRGIQAGTGPYYEAPPRGFVQNFFDILGRPQRALSELIGEIGEGPTGDPLAGVWRGLAGRYEHPTLGYQVFKESREPGFQPGDVGAFALDMVTDPTIWLGPGILKAVGKPLARGAYKAAAKLAPEYKAVLPEMEALATVGDKVASIGRDIKTLGVPLPQLVTEVKSQFPKILFPALKKSDDVAKQLERFRDIDLDVLRAHLRMANVNFRPAAQTLTQSIAQAAGQKLLPVASFLRNYMGAPGASLARKFGFGLIRSRIQAEKYLTRLEKIYKGMNKADRIMSSKVREGLAAPVGKGAERISRAANEMGGLLDEVAGDIIKFKDEWGEGIKVFNPGSNKWEPFVQHVSPNYFPHRWDPKVLTFKGQQRLRKQLIADGVPLRDVDKMVKEITTTTPKRVGHLEKVRHPHNTGYLRDPMDVLPKYINDSFYRVEMAREFGVSNRALDAIAENLKRSGTPTPWVDKLLDVIIGRNPHDRWAETLVRTLTGVQSVGKLGFATAVSNTSQLMNQVVEMGAGNLLLSAIRGGVPGVRVADKYRQLGAAAYGRSVREDITRMATGAHSWFMDKYMKAIGFDWSERAGRHLGAVGGSMDADDMINAWTKMRGEGKKAGRLLSELRRKYDIDLDQPFKDYKPGAMGTVRDAIAANEGRAPWELLEHAGIRGADTTMHAFNVMELPLGWRDPTWRVLLQFKSFIYKQQDFIMNQIAKPAIQYLATDGAQGSLWPLARASFAFPAGAELVTHFRDWVKSAPTQAMSLLSKGKTAKWNYKKEFWRDPSPPMRYLSDLIYIGALGMVGDMFEAAQRGRLLRWMAGPTMSDIADYGEALGGRIPLGKPLTRQLPGALGIPYGKDIFE